MDLRKKEYPLRRVVRDYWTHDRNLVCDLECGHRVLAPRDRFGARPAKRRRCYECGREKASITQR